MKDPKSPSPVIIGGVDTHKELHVAAVVDATDTVLATESLSTTRAGYRAMLGWMRSYGDIARVGVECTGSYGAGLMRHLDTAGFDVLEVTAGDKTDRRKRGKDDTIDAEQAAHAAFARVRTVTPRAHDGMVESLRALKIVRKTAIAGRRTALQMIQALIISAPEELRDQLRTMTRMQLIRNPGRVAARPERLPRPGNRHEDRAQVSGPPLPGAARRDRRPRGPPARPGRRAGPGPTGTHRHRLRISHPATDHRRRQPRQARLRRVLRDALRHRAATCIFRQDHPTPTLVIIRPLSYSRAVAGWLGAWVAMVRLAQVFRVRDIQ